MENHILTIKEIEKATHDVLILTLNKPDIIDFVPGQAAKLAIDKKGWRDKAHPFAFTSLPSDDYLEFTIKIYPEHEGVANELSKVEIGDQLILKDIFGTIHYKGKGTFIAGGAGIAPFISIIRNLNRKNKLSGNQLIFANRTENDIINQKELGALLEDDFLNILEEEKIEPYEYGLIDSEYLKNNIASVDDYFYICGPIPMIDVVEDALEELGVDKEQIIKEIFD